MSTKNAYNRHYKENQPNSLQGPPTWSLTDRDVTSQNVVSGGVTTLTPDGTGTLATGQTDVIVGNLDYTESSGNIRKAMANNVSTSRPVGVAINNASAGETVKYITNVRVHMTAASSLIEGAPSSFTPNTKYYLSQTTAGKWDSTPDTTTSGKIVVPCGYATNNYYVYIEIQPLLVV